MSKFSQHQAFIQLHNTKILNGLKNTKSLIYMLGSIMSVWFSAQELEHLLHYVETHIAT